MTETTHKGADGLKRIRLSRRAGWKLPEGAVNCAGPGPLGNPFVVGLDGTRDDCVRLHRVMLGGYLCVSCKAPIEAQRAHKAYVAANLSKLRGRDLACWCALPRPGEPDVCHAATLLEIANAIPSAARRGSGE